MAGESSVDAAPSPQQQQQQPAPRRKFAVQPVETSSRSSKAERGKEQDKENTEQQQPEKPRRRFLPQPVEETSRTSRRGGAAAGGTDEPQSHGQTAVKGGDASAAKKPRKFAVEPVETVKRSRRRNSTGPTLQPGDRTDETPTDAAAAAASNHLAVPSAPSPPANSPQPNHEGLPKPNESRFSYANLAKKASRQSSMRKPTLEPISSVPESEESNFSKRSSNSSDSSAHEDARQLLKVPRVKRQPHQKESYEEVFSGYLLDIAAKAAQQQLREQVAEAYPNERLYEPVDHFAVDRESDSDVEAVGQLPDTNHDEFSDRRESSAGWHATELKRHKQTLEQQIRGEKEQKQDQKPNPKPQQRQEPPKKMQLPVPKVESTRLSPTTPKKDPFGNPFNLAGIGAEGTTGTDPELKRMQDKARPPMLGSSLVFPKCQSPRRTMIDPLQRHGTRRNTGLASRQNSGLWSPGGPLSPASRHQSPKSTLCLWGGNCTAEQAARMRGMFPSNMQTGIMTPQYAPDEDPFERYANDGSLQHAQTIHQKLVELQASKQQQTVLPQQAARHQHQAPPHHSPHNSQHQLPTNPGGLSSSSSRPQSLLGIDQLLVMEQRIEQEYPDAFVTQIYNYLSLGYPAIARDYDEELGKISKMAVDDIRRDDARKNTKGYVGAPEGNGLSQTAAREECGRWRALRLYIREWARQQPNMLLDDGADATWGARARRGSWFA